MWVWFGATKTDKIRFFKGVSMQPSRVAVVALCFAFITAGCQCGDTPSTDNDGGSSDPQDAGAGGGTGGGVGGGSGGGGGQTDSGTQDAGEDAGLPDAGPTVPGSPTLVWADAGVRAAMVSWVPPSGTGGAALTGYSVVRWTGTTAGTATQVPATQTTVVVAGLANATTYTFTVAAQNNVGQGPDSAPSNAITTPDVPSAPVVTAATPVTQNTSSTASVPAVVGETYAWTITGGTITSAGGAAGVTTNGINAITFTAGAPGTFSINCAATDEIGTGALGSATVTSIAAPSITSFTAATTTITAGASTTLTAVFQGGTASIDNGVGAVNSTTAVTVTPAQTSTYTLTVTNAAGAIDTRTTTITVVPPPAISSFSSNAATISEGGNALLTPVFSNGAASVDNGIGAVTSGTSFAVSPNTTTTYVLTVTNAAGSQATRSVAVTVVPLPTINSFSAARSTITAGESVALNGAFQNGMGSIDNGVGAVTSGMAATVTPSSTTTYTLTVTNSAGGQVTRTATVTVVPPPAITSFTAGAATITAGQSTTLTGVFQAGTGDIDNSVGNVTSNTPVTVTPASTTTYTLTVTNPAGAQVMRTVTVTVAPPATIDSFAASPLSIAQGASATLTATFPNGTGSVNNGVGTVMSGVPVTVSPATTTTYTLTVTNAAGGQATATVTVTVVPPPTIFTFTRSPATITDGSSSTLTPNFQGGTGVIDNGVGAVTANTGYPVTPTTTTTYTLTVTNSVGVAQTRTATVTVVPPPVITSFTSAASSITAGQSTTITGVFQDGTGAVNNGVGAVTSGTARTVSPTTTTTYRLTVTNAAGTPVTANVTVTVVAAPSIGSFTAAANPITVGTSTTLTAVFGNGTGAVDNGVGSVTTNTAVTVTPAATTTYTLTVNNSLGATATRTVTVTVVPAPQQPVITAPSSVVAGARGVTATVTASAGMTYLWSATGAYIANPAGVTAGGVNTVTFNSQRQGGQAIVLSCIEVNAANAQSTPGTASVNVLTGPASPHRTTLIATPSSAPADGTTTIALRLTVRDAGGTRLSNAPVGLTHSGSGVTLLPPFGVTDAAGVFNATLTSATVQKLRVTATSGTATTFADVMFSALPCATAVNAPNPRARFDSTAALNLEHRITTGDFNKDGFEDLAATGENRLRLLFGNGKGDFLAEQSIPTSNRTQAALVADFNKDGNLDLAVSVYGGCGACIGTLVTLLSDGVGGYAAQTRSVGSSPSDMAVGDLNGDGDLDLVLANSTSITVMIGSPTGAFTVGTPVAVPSTTRGVALGRVNGDAFLDLVSVSDGSAGTLNFAPGNGDGTFGVVTSTQLTQDPDDVVAGDLDADGDADLVISFNAPAIPLVGLALMRGNGDGTFSNSTLVSNNAAYDVALKDFNGDGRLDISAVFGTDFRVFTNAGAGLFAPPQPGDVVPGARSHAVADFNEDGVPDVAAIGIDDLALNVTFGRSDGTFVGASFNTVPSALTDSRLVDVNGDGALDLVAANNTNTVTIIRSVATGAATRSDITVGTGLTRPNGVGVGDLNGDGRLDVVTANNFGNSVSVLLGTTTGFASPVSYTGVTSPTTVAIADFDGDGFADVALNHFATTADVLVFSGRGDGTLGAARTYDLSLRTSLLAAGDLNDDGLMDLATADNNLTVLLSLEGAAGFSVLPSQFSATRAASFHLTDLSGDGALDVVTGDGFVNGMTSVYLHNGNGDGTFSAQTLALGSRSTVNLDVADLNSDGRADLLAAHSDVDAFSITLRSVTGTYSAQSHYLTRAYAGQNGASRVHAGDITGDGRPDVLTAHFGGMLSLSATSCAP